MGYSFGFKHRKNSEPRKRLFERKKQETVNIGPHAAKLWLRLVSQEKILVQKVVQLINDEE